MCRVKRFGLRLAAVAICAGLLASSTAGAAARVRSERESRAGHGARGRALVTTASRGAAPVSLHRLLRDHLVRKLLQLLSERPTGGIGTLGLSDDPDPTGNDDDAAEDIGGGPTPVLEQVPTNDGNPDNEVLH